MSLLLGPLFGPVLFSVLINMTVSRNLTSLEEVLEVPILGASTRRTSSRYLARAQHRRRRATTASRTSSRRRSSSRRASTTSCSSSTRSSATDFGTERAARVALIFDRSKSRAASRVGRVRGAIDAYGQQIGVLRLVANGVDPSLLRPLVVDELDVSTPASRSALMLGVLTYFLLFATLTGGLHLAIDTTAGERERKSLEPLLTLPVARASLLSAR